MSSGSEGLLTLTIKMRVSPEPSQCQELIGLMERYREVLNYAVRAVIENKSFSLGKAHKLLYTVLKERYGLPSKIAQDCYREAIAPSRGLTTRVGAARVRTPRLWLTHEYSYRVRDGYVEILGGFRLRVIGWDRRYDDYPNGDARLLLKDGKFILEISKRIPKLPKYTSRGILAVDVNENYIVIGNSKIERRLGTAVERALHYKRLAENLQKKYSSTRYNVWLRSRVSYYHSKARRIIEDWVKKTSHETVASVKQH